MKGYNLELAKGEVKTIFNHNGTIKYIVKRTVCRHYVVKTINLKTGFVSAFKRTAKGTIEKMINLVLKIRKIKRLKANGFIQDKKPTVEKQSFLSVATKAIKKGFKSLFNNTQQKQQNNNTTILKGENYAII